MKEAKLDPPGGTTFNSRGSTFWPFFKHAGVQNWTLNRLNPEPPWRSGFETPSSDTELAIEPRTSEAPTPSKNYSSLSSYIYLKYLNTAQLWEDWKRRRADSKSALSAVAANGLSFHPTGRPFWAKPVLRRFSDPELGPLEQAVL